MVVLEKLILRQDKETFINFFFFENILICDTIYNQVRELVMDNFRLSDLVAYFHIIDSRLNEAMNSLEMINKSNSYNKITQLSELELEKEVKHLYHKKAVVMSLIKNNETYLNLNKIVEDSVKNN